MTEPGIDANGGVSVEAKKITDRIQRVEMARGLAEAGEYDKALALLRKVRDSYTEEHMQQKVDWLIAEIERKQEPEAETDS